MKAALLAVLVAACATLPVEQPPVLVISDANVAFLSELTQRMKGHDSLPDTEMLLCVYGRVDGNRVTVDRFGATTLGKRDSISVHFRPCPGRPDLLGIWHSHPTIPGYLDCAFSPVDLASFARLNMTVTMLSCDNGRQLLSRVKRGYSR